MCKFLLTLICILLPFILLAQESFFECYRDKNKLVYLTSDDIALSFYPYVTQTNGAKVKLVNSKDTFYKIMILPSENGTVKEVFDERDSLLATVSRDNKSILLPNGKALHRKKISSGKWSYQVEGKSVVTYSAKKGDGRKSVQIQFHDPAYEQDAVQLICLEQGSKKLKSNPTLAMVGAACGLALLRVAVASGE